MVSGHDTVSARSRTTGLIGSTVNGVDQPAPKSEMALDVAGLGIIMFSPSAATHIREGEDYLQPHYWRPEDVEEHVQAGSIVAFATSTPGTFVLRFHEGYPDEQRLSDAEFKVRLGVRSDGILVVRDLYELLDWREEFGPEESIPLPAGIYHVTLFSNRPHSGVLGDNQVIEVYFQPLDEFPALARQGVPTLIS
jgi:hypothetical protein